MRALFERRRASDLLPLLLLLLLRLRLRLQLRLLLVGKWLPLRRASRLLQRLARSRARVCVY